MSERKTTILVVDDELTITSLIRVALESELGEECSVLVANNTQDALGILKTEEIDQLWLDNRMPGETGIAFAHRIRRNPVEYPFVTNMRFVLITATQERDLKPEDKALFTELFPKPFPGIEEILCLARRLR